MKIMTRLLLAALIASTTLVEVRGDSYLPKPLAIDLSSPQIGLNIKTSKIARIYGFIGADSLKRFTNDMMATAALPGPRVIVIESGGGEVSSGTAMIDAIKIEKAQGTQIVCVVLRNAHSMAFNFLTNCTTRLMAPNAWSLVHKIDRTVLPSRVTAQVLRVLADELDRLDLPFKSANCAAMHISAQEYDIYTALETYWKAETLLQMGYLHGYGVVKSKLDIKI